MGATIRQRSRLLAAFALLLVWVPMRVGQAADATGTVRGTVGLVVKGLSLADVAPLVVFLEPLDGRTASPAPMPSAEIRQKNAVFQPGFLVVTVGQTIHMPNDDSIYHNVFSFSKPNDFDLGIYSTEQTRSIKFKHPGAVKLYCSIHESMNGTVYVAPSTHFALVPDSGAFELRGVPPGRYRLRTWSEMLPDTSQTLRVAPGQSATARIQIGQTDP